jgi:predicted DNA-binding protein
MSDPEVQISAFIARETKERLDAYAVETGTKKAHIVEDAIEAYLAARDETPAEYLAPREIVLTPSAFDRVIELLDEPPEPTGALTVLMSERDGG